MLDVRSMQVYSTSNHHYTTLPFTNGLGEPVLCKVNISSDYNTVLDIMGVDVTELDTSRDMSEYASVNKILELTNNSKSHIVFK